MPLFLSACPSVLETELDTAEIITDEEFATVSRLDCIIGYHFRLHGHGQMQKSPKISMARLPEAINIPAWKKFLLLVRAARKKVLLVPMSEVENDLREMEKDLHLHVQRIREAPVHRHLLSKLNNLGDHIWPMSRIPTLQLLWRIQWGRHTLEELCA